MLAEMTWNEFQQQRTAYKSKIGFLRLLAIWSGLSVMAACGVIAWLVSDVSVLVSFALWITGIICGLAVEQVVVKRLICPEFERYWGTQDLRYHRLIMRLTRTSFEQFRENPHALAWRITAEQE